MNCERLRERISADPVPDDAEFSRHAEECAPCRAYRERLLRAEDLIRKALRFGVSDLMSAAEANDRLRTGQRRYGWMFGAAASTLVAVTVWLLVGPAGEVSADELATAVVEHWDHEPESLERTNVALSAEMIADVLDGSARLDIAPGTVISYVKMCRIAGERVPHLVVQGEQGPFMVVLLPGRLLESAVQLEARELGLAGRIVPAGTGSIAVLGADSDELNQVETLFSSAVSWSI